MCCDGCAVGIRHEEKMLVEELSGYAEYRERVRYRIIPMIWKRNTGFR